MADRLTQLQDAVNSVSNFALLVSVFPFPEIKQEKKRDPRETPASGERTEAGLRQKALAAAAAAGGGAASWEV